MSERKKNGQFKGNLERHVEGEGAGLAIADFQRDIQAVEAWRAFLNTPHGIKLRKIMVACSPMNILASVNDAMDPVKLRILPKVEDEAAPGILARDIGHETLRKLLVETLTTAIEPPKPGRADLLIRKWESDEE